MHAHSVRLVSGVTPYRLLYSQDLYMAFQDNAEREHWYHMLKEMLCGWELSQSM